MFRLTVTAKVGGYRYSVPLDRIRYAYETGDDCRITWGEGDSEMSGIVSGLDDIALVMGNVVPLPPGSLLVHGDLEGMLPSEPAIAAVNWGDQMAYAVTADRLVEIEQHRGWFAAVFVPPHMLYTAEGDAAVPPGQTPEDCAADVLRQHCAGAATKSAKVTDLPRQA